MHKTKRLYIKGVCNRIYMREGERDINNKKPFAYMDIKTMQIFYVRSYICI